MIARWTYSFLLCGLLLVSGSAARADLKAAITSYEEGDFGTALVELTPLAQRGNVKAQFYLGEMYFRGEGVEVDYAEAYRWYFSAAENGYPPAQLNVGSMQALGLGTEKSVGDAYYWLIISGVWSAGGTSRAAFRGLTDVASILSDEEKEAIARKAAKSWQGR